MEENTDLLIFMQSIMNLKSLLKSGVIKFLQEICQTNSLRKFLTGWQEIQIGQWKYFMN